MGENAKMEFQTNIPETVLLLKNFANGQNNYGPWHGWELEHNGEKKTFFPPQKLHEEMDLLKGKSVIITKKETKNNEGKPYHFFTINEALFGNDGKPTPTPEPRIEKDPDAYDKFRSDRVNRLAEAIIDVQSAIGIVESNGPTPFPPFTSEDVRAMAISLMISFDRKTQ